MGWGRNTWMSWFIFFWLYSTSCKAWEKIRDYKVDIHTPETCLHHADLASISKSFQWSFFFRDDFRSGDVIGLDILQKYGN